MKIKQPILFVLLLQLLFTNSAVFSQSQGFHAGLIAGLNFSELEGDGITDYFGLNAGIFGSAQLSPQTQVGIAFLFSQNGEYILPQSYPALTYGKVWLNHLEIPIHFDWLIEVFKKEQFRQLQLNFGVAYTRLFHHFAEDINQVDVSDQIIYDDKDAFLAQGGLTYFFTPKVGLNLKASLPIRKQDLDWTIAARLIYQIK